MTFLATTRIAVLRGTEGESPLGDEVVEDETIVPAYADMPASLIERNKSVFDQATQTRRTVRVVKCRIPTATGHPTTGVVTPVVLEEGDRIRDLSTGREYAIDDALGIPRNLAGQSSLTLELRDTATTWPAA